jgi:hypothetical protein
VLNTETTECMQHYMLYIHDVFRHIFGHTHDDDDDDDYDYINHALV